MADESAARDTWEDLSEKDKVWIIRKIEREARETIKRPEPLLKASAGDYVTLTLGDTSASTTQNKKPQKSTKPGKQTKVVELDSDDDDNDAGDTLIPGPGRGERLDYNAIRRQIGFTVDRFDEYYGGEWKNSFHEYIYRSQSAGAAHTEYADVEAMLQHDDWLPYLNRKHDCNDETSTQLLFRGFPMIEDVAMIAHPNKFSKRPKPNLGQIASDQENKIIRDPGELFNIDDGNCYFTAIALLIYGNARAWLRVKAEHLYHLEKMLSDPLHVRHEFYKRHNAIFSKTFATRHGPDGTRWEGNPNLWERLQIPNCWMSDEICPLTADVYGVFLVLYSFTYNQQGKRGSVYDLRTYGSYNSRHIFAAYVNSNHFVPLIPNSYYHYEFTLPRIRLQVTDRYKNKLRTTNKNHTNKKDGLEHHFRCSPQSIPGPLSYPTTTELYLSRAVGFRNLPRHPVSSTNVPQPKKRVQTRTRSRPLARARRNPPKTKTLHINPPRSSLSPRRTSSRLWKR
ncbi:hypothetical protein V8F20_007101 [Naviculisporaceae sp. PSN 640]